MGHLVARLPAGLILTVLLCGCPSVDSDNPSAQPARKALSEEIEVLLDVDFVEGANINSFLHPDGGFLVCTAGADEMATISRRDERGREQWLVDLGGRVGLAVLHVDDAGRIYVMSESLELVVLDDRGVILWTMPGIRHWPTPDNFGNGDDNIFLLVKEELKCLDRDGNVIWGQTRLGEIQTLLVDRDAADGPLIYYAGIEQHADVRYDKYWIMRMCLDPSNGKGIWRKQQKVRQTAYTRFYPGCLDLLEDGRLLLLLPDSLFLIDDKGEAMALLDEDLQEGDEGLQMTGAEAQLLANGNIVLCNNNQRIRSDDMRVLELSPEGETVSDITFDETAAGFLNSDVGSAYYDFESDRVYMFMERVKNVGKGRIAVFDRQANKLAEYEAGFGYITRFIKAADGRMIAHREGGDLLLCPGK